MNLSGLIYLFVFYFCEKQRGSSLTSLLTGHTVVPIQFVSVDVETQSLVVNKCIKHSILADILPHKLMPILLSECTRIHLLTQKKSKNFWGRPPDPPPPTPSPAPTFGRRGSDLRPLQQGRLVLCQIPLLLFFLLKTLLRSAVVSGFSDSL